MSLEAWGDEGWDDRLEPAREAGWLDPTDLSKALLDVMAERDRQWNVEGWTPEHDDAHVEGELARAAATYALQSAEPAPTEFGVPMIWPWAPEWWKPSSRYRDLVKASALILAELERLNRAAASERDGT